MDKYTIIQVVKHPQMSIPGYKIRGCYDNEVDAQQAANRLVSKGCDNIAILFEYIHEGKLKCKKLTH